LVEPGVAQQDFAGSSGERYGKRRLFDDCPQPRFALPQRLLGPLALGDVLEDNPDPATVLSADAEGRRVEPLAAEPSDHVFEFHGLAGQGDAAVLIEPELLEVRDHLSDPLTQHRPRGVPDERRVGLQVAEVDGTAVLAEDHLDDAVRFDHRFEEVPVPSLGLAQRLVGRWRLRAPTLVLTSGGVDYLRRDVAGDRILEVLRPSFGRPERSRRPVEGTHPRPHLAAA
jgi:hypothetical protein